jgi:hypothetical protein
MLKKILIAVALLVVIFVIVVALQPSNFKVTRVATMAAAPDKVFAQVNDFHNWAAWSPWAKMDPEAKNSFEGASSGQGAVFRWTGNSDVGAGSMEITESRPNDLIRLVLNFTEPMAGICDTEFRFVPDGDGTKMTWTMTGENGFIGRAICMFMSMDKMVGGQFEDGMANIKAIVERP